MGTFNLRIPDSIHKHFKSVCVVNEENMHDVIVRLIEDYIWKEDKDGKYCHGGKNGRK